MRFAVCCSLIQTPFTSSHIFSLLQKTVSSFKQLSFQKKNMSGWTCCSRRVLEFDEFLKIKGCQISIHRFTDPVKSPLYLKFLLLLLLNSSSHFFSLLINPTATLPLFFPFLFQNQNLKTTQSTSSISTSSDLSSFPSPRRDFYQTPTTVILSIFAKFADSCLTNIQFSETRLSGEIHYKRPGVLTTTTSSPLNSDLICYPFDFQLFQPILPSSCTFQVLGSKIEICLVKGNGFSWPSLEVLPQGSQGSSWTTFGVSGKTGTVGGKNAIIAGDAPLNLNQ